MQDKLATAAAEYAGLAAARRGFRPVEAADDFDHPESTGAAALPAVIMIRYRNSAGQVSDRAVSIHRVWRDDGVLYLQGACQLRHALRTFRVDRIETLVCLTTGEVSENPNDWLCHHAFLTIAPEADYTPHALRRLRDELAILAFIALSDQHFDPDEVEIAIDLVMMSTEEEIDRDHAARYIRRLSPTALDLGDSVRRVAEDEDRWNCLARSIRRLVDADRMWPIEEQLAVDEIETMRSNIAARLSAPLG